MVDGDVILSRMVEALLVDYTNVYYVNAVSKEYISYSIDPQTHTLKIDEKGKDFFARVFEDAEKIVYKDDRHFFQNEMQSDQFLKRLKESSMKSIKYRLMINGVPVYHTLRLIREQQDVDDYYILGVMNIEGEMKEDEKKKKIERERDIYSQIAESLAEKYDVIYYINIYNNTYMEFNFENIFGSSILPEEGQDFWTEADRNADRIVYIADVKRVQKALRKDFLCSVLKKKKSFEFNYRIHVDGEIKNTRFTAFKSGDKKHIIIGVENVDDEAKKEKEFMTAMRRVNERARRDELTGVKNQFAYHEMEKSMQKRIEHEEHLQFAILVADLNHLKHINDTFGHKTGDEYIKEAGKMICEVFVHSPVFRIGGDEFAVILTERDYFDRENLFRKLRGMVIENQKSMVKPIIATGISAFDSKKDKTVSEVFEAADRMMYENKRELKQMNPIQPSIQDIRSVIPEDQKKRLDSLFEAFSMISKTTEVYLCNMKYDYSRWSKAVVEAYQLPSVYIYGAGEMWERYVHPDDLLEYRHDIKSIFVGNEGNLDLSYRVRRPDGTYVECYSQGVVIRDEKDEPAYFAGFFKGLI